MNRKSNIFDIAKLHNERIFSFLQSSVPHKYGAVVLKHFRSFLLCGFATMRQQCYCFCLNFKKA